MIKIKDASPATVQLLDDVSDLVGSATLGMSGARTKAALEQIATGIATRNITQLSSADPTGVQLTDDQWAALQRKVQILAGFGAESW